ncbi:insulin-like peptide INSL5 [Rhinatrema bivittatum]|uniref:insulin-like peptide INSL5 n=1 Tax=Rhinatrema bivittatum TaxID=194408 RepID=UPI00112DE6ED|nr:insulin-like peptide INSL5 [Rhinatrema bivittatum]
MRAFILCFCLLSLLAIVSRAKADGRFKKICGREFIRAVIYTCGGSRWRRLPAEEETDLPDGGNPSNSFHRNGESAEILDYGLQKMESQTEVIQNKRTQPAAGFWNRGRERRDLPLSTACCVMGCSDAELSSLC